MAGDPKVYALGLDELEMQNPCEFNEHPREQNIPKTHRNHCLGQTLPEGWLRYAKRLTLLLRHLAVRQPVMNSDVILRPVAMIGQRFPEHVAVRRGIRAK
jgi:hypothetical protein